MPLLLLLMQFAAGASGGATPSVSGQGSPTVTIPRAEAPVVVDGRLDEPVWDRQVGGRKGTRFTVIYRSRALFVQYRDKDFSFTDCTSFAVMRELGLTHVITTDRHFRQMGFDVLPGPRGRAKSRRAR